LLVAWLSKIPHLLEENKKLNSEIVRLSKIIEVYVTSKGIAVPPRPERKVKAKNTQTGYVREMTYADFKELQNNKNEVGNYVIVE